MSAWLVAATGMAYAFVAGEMWWKGNFAMAVVWTGYAFAQAGLYAITKSA
jgi:hypothetical protein